MVGAWMARRLERGVPAGKLLHLASRVWATAARVERQLRWRDDARVIVVGGATLGGSGKTPLATACAAFLQQRGARVALVGHAFGARPRRPRLVSGGDEVGAVGDEALECARRLGARVPVAVAPTRQAALDLALEVADVAVVDGVGQTRPRRASLALLAVDAAAPWGSGLCPPLGDLRASASALLAQTDCLVAVGSSDPCPELSGVEHARVVSEGAWLDGSLLGWTELARLRVGLVTAIARPERVVAMLGAHGVVPKVAIHGPDHHPPSLVQTRSGGLDLWLCTPKCRTHLGLPGTAWGGAPLATVDYSLCLGEGLRALLDPRVTHP